ncbi:agamous-like MADS-box protein MADS9 [Cornus florida]|uniref:agamous-like MADS-box protein MADS9 n=1 Tax=Cornus florida TaxID=4283 RepID=UPI002898BFDB|nr:agamous-like MADS-box protein MADS9 [Cornus florida]
MEMSINYFPLLSFFFFFFLSLSILTLFLCKCFRTRERGEELRTRESLLVLREREMGRGKIEIKRIENSNNRQVTYSKRRNGIMNKAKEIAVLCDSRVSLVIFARFGKMHEYCSPSTKLTDVLDQYQKQSGKRLWDAKHENVSNELDRIKKESDRMQIYQQEMAMDGNVRDMEKTFHQSEFQPQMPFHFRVQPSQPNLQERFWNC